MRISLRTLEKIYVVFALLFFTNGIIQVAVAEGDVYGQAKPVIGDSILQILVVLLLMPLLAMHWKEILGGLKQSGWLIALCGLVLASTAWSIDWKFTARRSIMFCIVTLFAVYVASCFDWDEKLDMFAWMSMIVVLGSAFMAIFVPYYGVSHDIHAGSVKGIFPHRSIMARQMVFAILTLWLGKPKGLPVWLRNLTLVGAGILLILSHAATSALALLVCIAMYPVLHLLRVQRRNTLPLWLPLMPLFAAGVYLVLSNFALILETAGRDSTLTGRTAIWKLTLQIIGKRPWLGYGYDVFWNRYTGELATAISWLQFRPPHAHNGYLDILVGMGIVGLLLFLGGFVTIFWRAGSLFRANEIQGAKWPLLILLFFAIFNVTESNILRPLTFLWIPYAMIYVSLGLMKAEAREEAFAESRSNLEESGATTDGLGGMLPAYGKEGLVS